MFSIFPTLEQYLLLWNGNENFSYRFQNFRSKYNILYGNKMYRVVAATNFWLGFVYKLPKIKKYENILMWSAIARNDTVVTSDCVGTHMASLS